MFYFKSNNCKAEYNLHVYSHNILHWFILFPGSMIIFSCTLQMRRYPVRTTSAHDRCRRINTDMWKNTRNIHRCMVFETSAIRRWRLQCSGREGVEAEWEKQENRAGLCTVAPLVVYYVCVYKHRPTYDHKRVTPV